MALVAAATGRQQLKKQPVQDEALVASATGPQQPNMQPFRSQVKNLIVQDVPETTDEGRTNTPLNLHLPRGKFVLGPTFQKHVGSDLMKVLPRYS